MSNLMRVEVWSFIKRFAMASTKFRKIEVVAVEILAKIGSKISPAEQIIVSDIFPLVFIEKCHKHYC